MYPGVERGRSRPRCRADLPRPGPHGHRGRARANGSAERASRPLDHDRDETAYLEGSRFKYRGVCPAQLLQPKEGAITPIDPRIDRIAVP